MPNAYRITSTRNAADAARHDNARKRRHHSLGNVAEVRGDRRLFIVFEVVARHRVHHAAADRHGGGALHQADEHAGKRRVAPRVAH